jgi:hypothetical protein
VFFARLDVRLENRHGLSLPPNVCSGRRGPRPLPRLDGPLADRPAAPPAGRMLFGLEFEE